MPGQMPFQALPIMSPFGLYQLTTSLNCATLRILKASDGDHTIDFHCADIPKLNACHTAGTPCPSGDPFPRTQTNYIDESPILHSTSLADLVLDDDCLPSLGLSILQNH